MLENLLLTLNDDNLYEAFIVTYDLSEQEKELIINNLSVDLSDKVTFIQIDNQDWINNINTKNGIDSCYDFVEVVPECGYPGHHTAADRRNGTNGGSECAATYVAEPYYVLQETDCTDDNNSGFNSGTSLYDDFNNLINESGGNNNDNGNSIGNSNVEDDSNNEAEVEDCLQIDLNGNCIRKLTKPIPKENKKPCIELTYNSNDADFKSKMQILKNAVSGNTEKTFGIYNGMYVSPPSSNPSFSAIFQGNEQNSGTVTFAPALKAIAHNHLKNSIYNHIGTFSPNDLMQLSNLIIQLDDNNSLVIKDEIASYLVCDEGNYALKIKDKDKLYNFVYLYGTNNVFRKVINDFYKKNNMAHGKSKKEQNIGFLKLIQKFNIGIDLYEADGNFENWKKLRLSSNKNDINKTEC